MCSEIGAHGSTRSGKPLIPGYNVDYVDLDAGLNKAREIGYSDANSLMVVEYALMRHKRAEEEGAQRTALSGGIDLTSWYMILAAARTGKITR